jgi:hypothetical protein
LHFLFTTDLRQEHYDLFLFSEDQHSENLVSIISSNLPGAEAFIPFDSLPRNNTRKSTFALRSVAHLSPLQMQHAMYILLRLKSDAEPNFYSGEFYKESGRSCP